MDSYELLRIVPDYCGEWRVERWDLRREVCVMWLWSSEASNMIESYESPQFQNNFSEII